MKEKEYAEIDVMTIRETLEAVMFDDGDESFWIPKSVMEDWPEEHETGTAMVEAWFAEMKELV